MENIEFVKVGETQTIYGEKVYGTSPIYVAKLKVDIQLGGTLYKDAVITISENTLRRIARKYESHAGSWGGGFGE